jgi:hypothetical protein
MQRLGKGKEVDFTVCPPKIDKLTFFSPFIPDEVRYAVPYLHAVSRDIVLKIIDDVLSDESICDKEDSFVILYTRAFALSAEEVSLLLTAIQSIARFTIKNKVTFQTISTDLKKMNIPDPINEHFVMRMRQRRSALEKLATLHRVGFPVLRRLRWRVDVVISTGSLGRVMKPVLMLQMILNDATVKTFEVSVEQFNQLRFGAAKVLQDMQLLERHPILRIVNEFEKRNVDERFK